MNLCPVMPRLLLLALVVALTGCAAVPSGFPLGKNIPVTTSTTIPSECRARGKSAAEQNDWGTAYRWFARGGGWNDQGRSTGFPPPGRLPEPEESQRFLCITSFLEATHHLLAQGIRVDSDGVHPLYLSLTQASLAISYFRNAHPNGYAGLTDAQIAALQQKLSQGGESDAAPALTASRDATMDTLEQVDRKPSQLKTFQDTLSTTAARPAEAARADTASPDAITPSREIANLRHQPPNGVPVSLHGSHAEAARLYREAAAKYPEGDSRRKEMLDLAAEEEREAGRP